MWMRKIILDIMIKKNSIYKYLQGRDFLNHTVGLLMSQHSPRHNPHCHIVAQSSSVGIALCILYE